MDRLNEFRDILSGLEAIVGPDIIRSHGLAIILCLATAANLDEDIDLATLAEKIDIRPASLDRYIKILKDADVIELQRQALGEWGTTSIVLTQRTRFLLAKVLSMK